MIEYKKLTWSNCFSYGEDNSIDFTCSPLLQLVGPNGNGKSSIALILEEVLFNKNSKGVKKQNILNRYSKAKSYSIGLTFSINEDEYEIKTTRGSTQTVALFKNGIDISQHTATNTFKEIEKLIGYDHKTFSQIVYQSSISSLEFLTATDTQRKKFLIELLDLSIYTRLHEVLKAESTALSKDLAKLEGSLSVINDWIVKNKDVDLTINPLEVVPDLDQEPIKRLALINNEIENISATSKSINENNVYRDQLAKIKLVVPKSVYSHVLEEITSVKDKIAEITASNNVFEAQIKKLQSVKDKCPTCGQKLETVNTEHILQEISDVKSKLSAVTAPLQSLKDRLLELEKEKDEWVKYNSKVIEYERYSKLYNPDLQQTVPDVRHLKEEQENIAAVIKANELKIAKIIKLNEEISKDNSRKEIILSKIEEYVSEKGILEEKTKVLEKKAFIQNVLTKAFSTNGLIAYKIECMIKDLEDLTNEYLQQMSDGRFQLGFEIGGSDKLNVIITDNGADIDIAALSSGERARVNISCLLAIRKLMQSLSATRSNLLILDETLENLDSGGKERLIEVLLKEPNLNTVLISHSFTHPLIEKVSVIKDNNISRIEN